MSLAEDPRKLPEGVTIKMAWKGSIDLTHLEAGVNYCLHMTSDEAHAVGLALLEMSYEADKKRGSR